MVNILVLKKYKITSVDLQYSFYRHAWNLYHVIIPNTCIGGTNEMDLFCIRRNNYCEEFEIKISVADFKADFKKTACVQALDNEKTHRYSRYINIKKHEAIQQGRLLCNRFNFLLTEKIVDKCEIPDYAGIYVYSRTVIKKIRQGKLLHKNKIPESIWREAAHKMSIKHWHEKVFNNGA